MKKRGQFEIQFNWIFVLVAGAIILLLFSVIILRQKSASEKSIDASVSRNLEAIIAGAEVSKGVTSFVDLPKVEIDFECNRLIVGTASRRFEAMTVFTPSKISSNQMITWTLDWNLPYRVTNFLYLTSPDIRYILVESDTAGTDSLAKKINELMPEEMNKELITASEITNLVDKNDAKVRFIYFDDSIITTGTPIPFQFIKMSMEDITALEITPNTFNEDIGSVTFYNNMGSSFSFKGTSYYLKKPSLLGAIFADDFELYNCVMNNAFKKMNIVTKVYKQKTIDLYDYYENLGDNCKNFHYSTHLSSIESNTFSSSGVEAINQFAGLLETQNKEAQQNSCALIY